MREESHLDDMRSAVRGDFERLAERRGTQELMSVSPEESAPEPEPGPEPEPEPPEPEPELVPEPVPEPASKPAHAAPEPGEAMPEPGPDATRPEEPRRSWLDRLLGR